MLTSILLPPGINLLLLLVGLFGLKKFRRIAICLLFISVSSLYFLSMPIVSSSLLKSIEYIPAIEISQLKPFQSQSGTAIVVLSAGRQNQSLEYGNVDIVNALTLERLKYASWLKKRSFLPLLLSGGSTPNEATSEAVLMNETLLSSFNVAPDWIDSKSATTEESAINAKRILFTDNIFQIILVCHASQMAKNSLIFEQHGFKVIAAPLGFSSTSKKYQGVNDYMPNAQSLFQSSLALNEKLQLFWYKLRY